jgi:1-deoxy-D-xylulose-5-phosphate synthase
LGDMLPLAIATADRLVTKGYSVGVVNGRFAAPLDTEMILSQSRLARAFVTIENGVASGGFGSGIAETLLDEGYQGRVIRNGWPAEFVPQGAPSILMEKYGLTPDAVADRVVNALAR